MLSSSTPTLSHTPLLIYQGPVTICIYSYAFSLSLAHQNVSTLRAGRASNTVSHDWLKSESEVTQSCPTLYNPMDCSPPGSSIHGIFQATILEWVVISFSRRSSQPKDQTRVSCIVGDSLLSEPPGKSQVPPGSLLLKWHQNEPHHILSGVGKLLFTDTTVMRNMGLANYYT